MTFSNFLPFKPPALPPNTAQTANNPSPGDKWEKWGQTPKKWGQTPKKKWSLTPVSGVKAEIGLLMAGV
jgi:hypothetical protein